MMDPHSELESTFLSELLPPGTLSQPPEEPLTSMAVHLTLHQSLDRAIRQTGEMKGVLVVGKEELSLWVAQLVNKTLDLLKHGRAESSARWRHSVVFYAPAMDIPKVKLQKNFAWKRHKKEYIHTNLTTICKT